jgi:hypothetical protein
MAGKRRSVRFLAKLCDLQYTFTLPPRLDGLNEAEQTAHMAVCSATIGARTGEAPSFGGGGWGEPGAALRAPERYAAEAAAPMTFESRHDHHRPAACRSRTR